MPVPFQDRGHGRSMDRIAMTFFVAASASLATVATGMAAFSASPTILARDLDVPPDPIRKQRYFPRFFTFSDR